MKERRTCGERSLEEINKRFVWRVKKKLVRCPVCGRKLMEASEVNADIKCQKCKSPLVVLIKNGINMTIPDRRNHNE